MIRSEVKQRSLNACLIAGIVHLCIAILFTFFYYAHLSNEIEDVVGVEFIDMKDNQKQRRLKRPLPKQALTSKQTKSISDYRPKHVALKASSNLIDETLRPSKKVLMHNATKSVSETATKLPEVTTHATHLNSRTAALPKSVTSPFEISSGAGVKSLRQRVKGDGESGFHRLESKGTAEIGTIGEVIGERVNEKGGSGTNPIGEALKKIAEHIISTRELDKINVVFVLDTSASMRDNIQQVAENLYSMTDAFDLINIEYHFGMSEFSVREKGQKVETRALLPDVGVLRRRMKEVQLSGDENALDALLYTLDYMDFHTDAEKHLILVTDEPASTSLREKNAKINMREKVIDQSQFEEVRVNVLGFPEPFQETLADATGGVWEQIPGSLYNPAALPSNRVGNRPLLKLFKDIATDIQQNGSKMLFSLELQFEVLFEEGDIPINKIQQEFDNKELGLKTDFFSEGYAAILEKRNNDLLVITDYGNEQIYALRKDENKINVYAGASPNYWNLDANLIARARQSVHRWTVTDRWNNQFYSIRRDRDSLKVYIGAQPSASTTNNSDEPLVDVVVMLDYSRSMGGKADAVMLGLSTLIGRLSIFPLKYRIGLIRFAEAKDAIKTINGVVVSQMPLNESLIKRFMEEPFGGDEHLIDAIVEGVPKVKFSPYARRFLLILTDEPTTGKYPAERALEICQSLGITAYVIGHPDPNDFQTTLAAQTQGIFFPMPRHLQKAYPNQ